MYRRIRLTCSDTWRTLAMPSSAPVFDFSPRANQDSMPGRTPLNELRLSRLRCGSESRDRLLSSTKSMLPGGTASSIIFRSEPGFNAGQDAFERIAFEPFEVRFGKQGQTAFVDEVDAAGRNGVLDHIQIRTRIQCRAGRL